MAETYKELQPVKVGYICDECWEGELVFTGITKMSSPPIYVHKCSKCKETFNLRKQYPTIEYKEI